MTKFFNKFRKLCFWPIFGAFSQFLGQKHFFLENHALSRTTSCGFLAPCQDLEKTNDTILIKHPDRQRDTRVDGRTCRPYFVGPSCNCQGSNKAHFLIGTECTKHDSVSYRIILTITGFQKKRQQQNNRNTFPAQ